MSSEGSEDTGLLGVVGRTGDFVLFVLVFFVPLEFTLVFTSFGVLEGNSGRVDLK